LRRKDEAGRNCNLTAEKIDEDQLAVMRRHSLMEPAEAAERAVGDDHPGAGGEDARSALISPIFDLNPLERARTELKLAPGFLVRSAPKPRRVVDRIGA